MIITVAFSSFIVGKNRFPCFLLGLIFGFGFAFAVCAKRVDFTVTENIRLRDQLAESRQTLEKLKKSLTAKEKTVIEGIDTTFQGETGSYREELEKAVREKLQVFIGKNINDIDPEMVGELFKHVVVEAGPDTFRVYPVQIIIGRRCIFHFRVTVREPPGPRSE